MINISENKKMQELEVKHRKGDEAWIEFKKINHTRMTKKSWIYMMQKSKKIYNLRRKEKYF